MSLDILLASLTGGAVTLPVSIEITRIDAGSPVEFILDTDNYRYQRTGSVLTRVGPWVYGAPASDYEVRTVVTSGSFTADPSAGAWVSLGTTRLWSRGAPAASIQTVTATLEIRRATTLQVLSTTTLTLTCDRA